MATKLKLLLRKTRWLLPAKAAAFGASWMLFPFWAFLPVAAYLYFSSVFRSLKLLAPFLALIFFAAVEEPNIWLALVFSSVFYLTLGVKELLFANRRHVHEIFVLLLIFLMFLEVFALTDGWSGRTPAVYALAAAAATFFLAGGLLGDMALYGSAATAPVAPNVFAFAFAFLVFEAALAVFFLPLNFVYQAAVIFIFAAALLEMISDYAAGELRRERALAHFSVFFFVAVVVLGAAQWTL